MNREHLIKMETFHKKCIAYWTRVLGHDDREVYLKALEDVKNLKHDPFVPCGEILDKKTKSYFVKRCEMDLGIYFK